MKLSDTENLTCPFGTVNREQPVYCGGDNCMAWEDDGIQQEGEYMSRKGIAYGHCKLIGKVGK
jgi:hypothetical protein